MDKENDVEKKNCNHKYSLIISLDEGMAKCSNCGHEIFMIDDLYIAHKKVHIELENGAFINCDGLCLCNKPKINRLPDSIFVFACNEHKNYLDDYSLSEVSTLFEGSFICYYGVCNSAVTVCGFIKDYKISVVK